MTSPETHAYLTAIAAVMTELSDDIEMLGAMLCGDAEIVARHMHHLQAIDLIAQKQRAIAQLLEADCPVSALAGLGLEELAARLRGLSGGNGELRQVSV